VETESVRAKDFIKLKKEDAKGDEDEISEVIAKKVATVAATAGVKKDMKSLFGGSGKTQVEDTPPPSEQTEKANKKAFE
jgi:hypothetical protein